MSKRKIICQAGSPLGNVMMHFASWYVYKGCGRAERVKGQSRRQEMKKGDPKRRDMQASIRSRLCTSESQSEKKCKEFFLCYPLNPARF